VCVTERERERKRACVCVRDGMGWLRLVGALKLLGSFALEKSVSVGVCVCERERERKILCVCVGAGG